MKIFLFSVMFLFSVVLLAQNDAKKIDKRVYNYYTKEQVLNMPLFKQKQVNYLFSKSFVIPEEMKDKIDVENFDISGYNSFRKNDEDTKVYINFEKNTGPYFILLSKSKVNRRFKEIEAKYKK